VVQIQKEVVVILIWMVILCNYFLSLNNMEIQFSPVNDINLIQRSIKKSKKIKIKSTRFLNQEKLKKKSKRINRTCKRVIF